LSDEFNEKGISWKYPKSIFDNSVITKSRYLYHNRLSKLITGSIIENVRKRTEKYFDFLLIDEIQDFAGNDFNFLLHLFSGNFNLLLVGDFYQHTFDTSRDKQTNKSLHYDIGTYTDRFVKSGINIDKTTLLNSRRCSKSTCEFINTKIGIDIKSEFDYETECKLVTDESEIKRVFEDDSIVKLFYKKHYDFKCNSDNWGNCKGLTYENICVIINDEIFNQMTTNEPIKFKAQTTKNKFYVACSRTKNNLYFIHDKKLKKLQ
jgi:DNA helicase-2/ATP-dependent DNA helicase PcrA